MKEGKKKKKKRQTGGSEESLKKGRLKISASEHKLLGK